MLKKTKSWFGILCVNRASSPQSQIAFLVASKHSPCELGRKRLIKYQAPFGIPSLFLFLFPLTIAPAPPSSTNTSTLHSTYDFIEECRSPQEPSDRRSVRAQTHSRGGHVTNTTNSTVSMPGQQHQEHRQIRRLCLFSQLAGIAHMVCLNIGILQS